MLNKLLKLLVESLPENNRLERIWVLAKTDFLSRYYGSFIGVFWAYINPIIQFCIYYTVFGVIIPGRDPDFAKTLFLGLIVYIYFAEGITQGIFFLKKKKYIIENIPFKLYDAYIASILSVTFSFLINILIFVIIAQFVNARMSADIIFLPVLLINLVLFIAAGQLIFSTMYPLINDITHVWDKMKLALFWLSGIVYPIMEVSSPLKEILLYGNPLAGIICNFKYIFVEGKPINMYFLGYDFLYGMLAFGIAILINKRLFFKAVERI